MSAPALRKPKIEMSKPFTSFHRRPGADFGVLDRQFLTARSGGAFLEDYT